MEIKDTLNKRTNKYGSIADNAKVTQSLMKVIKQSPMHAELTDVHVESLHMIFHKIARMVCGDCMYNDNPHDIAGYATLLEEYINEVNNENSQ